MGDPIAIVGSACRFPGGANSPSKLWELLKSPRDVLGQVPSGRIGPLGDKLPVGQEDGAYRNHHNGRTGYHLEQDCRLFDAAFFRINNKEACSMDPQQRILLETVFEAFEGAGWPMDKVEGSSTSVHVGVMTADYSDIQMRDPDTLPTYAATGTARSILANRISYFFDLTGPSVMVDTACSSSLVALHQAIQCLRSGDAAQAVVAGVNLLLDSAMYVATSRMHMLSSDSRCRMWDEDAKGYARGEGSAVLLLKPLSKAIEDGDDIECIVVEAGVNSDGRSDGITMPKASSQADLIRKTYQKAGLNPLADKDRCQYFECHGTGTAAGDPVEASAIQQVFFPSNSFLGQQEAADPGLYCGSIKTVIGHLEGCAGLAGILKASLAMQNKTIPPNMHFSRLNPAIRPYYDHLCVPVSPVPWPNTHGGPMRASVNSFGFGGTNAHVILESFQPSGRAESLKPALCNTPVGPLVFSARTSSSLLAFLKRMSTHISQSPLINLDELSHHLHAGRTTFQQRLPFIVRTSQQLLESIEQHVHAVDVSPATTKEIGFRVAQPFGNSRYPMIMGIFTGQGAHWNGMGRELALHCETFRDSVLARDRDLRALPDPPSWSLLEKLLGGSDTLSDTHKAKVLQPLCTAIQISLVDLLSTAGVKFHAVVGHSSGEIAAAYAAGILTARDAMAIAYYRGRVVSQMTDTSSQNRGAMMATGLPFGESDSFCSQPRFAGRLCVAANNSPGSTTLSGDQDAIDEAKAIFDERKVFSRLLPVDIAYHSHHMLPCAQPYLEYLTRANIQPQPPRDDCTWYSSVQGYAGTRETPFQVKVMNASYWVANLVQPVLFHDALAAAFTSSSASAGKSPSAIIEVGPHPALKGAAFQTIKMITESAIPYSGTLSRRESDLESVLKIPCLLWTHFGPKVASFDTWRKVLFGLPTVDSRKSLKGLPSYAWDHDRIYWHESRLARQSRVQQQSPHELLGKLRADDDPQHELVWRNILRLEDVPWLRGHKFQGQIIFPGAGYVSMAVEAARLFTVRTSDHRAIKLIEIEDMEICRALVLADESEGGDGAVETVFKLRARKQQNDSPGFQHQGGSILEGHFSCSAGTNDGDLQLSCHGRLRIHRGQPTPNSLPAHSFCQDELPSLDIGRFSELFSKLGIDYDGPFRAMKSVNRIWGASKASASWSGDELSSEYALHPAILDAAFQAGFATFGSLAENALGTTYLPSGIRRIIIDPNQQYKADCSGDLMTDMEAHLVSRLTDTVDLDLNISPTSFDQQLGVQVEGLVLKAVGEPQPSDDRLIFAKTVWDIDVTSDSFTSTIAAVKPEKVAKEDDERELIDTIERTALYFLQQVRLTIQPDEVKGLKWHHRALLEAIDRIVEPVREDCHSILRKDWLGDSAETIHRLGQKFPSSVDLALVKAVGENLPSVMRGQTEILEHMLKDDLLTRLYVEGQGSAACNQQVAGLVASIVHKYPKANILEIGAGTGGTTRSVLGKIGTTYSSYTYTDISAGFFEKAAERFSGHSDMNFRVLNIERDPASQGFDAAGYDIVIAANVLHATRDLATTMRHVRSLLRPGAFLVAVEVTGSMLRETAMMGGLEGWWLGREDGRCLSPGVPLEQWDRILRDAGFSGTGCVGYDCTDVSRHSCAVFVSQAVDEQFELLKNPLTSVQHLPRSPLLIVGGQTTAVSHLVSQIEETLNLWAQNVKTCVSIDDVDISQLEPGTSVVCLAELDRAVFAEQMTAKRLENLQELFALAGSVIWVTSGRLARDPKSNMMTGIGRSLALEMPHVQMQFLDFDQVSSVDPVMISRHLLRMILLASPLFSAHGMLWAQEPELIIRDSSVHISRVIPDDRSNDLLNAQRRKLLKPVSEVESFEVSWGSGRQSPSLIQGGLINMTPTPDSSVDITVKLSTALHSRGASATCYLVFGILRRTGKSVFALSRLDASVIVANNDDVYSPSCSATDFECSAGVLTAFGGEMITSHMTSYGMPSTGTVLVHGVTGAIADHLLRRVPALMRPRILFISTDVRLDRPNWIYIHPLADARAVRSAIPRDTSLLWRISGDGETMDKNIQSCLSEGCEMRTFDISRLLSSHSHHRELLSCTWQNVQSDPVDIAYRPQVLNMDDIYSSSQSFSQQHEPLSTVMNWDKMVNHQLAVRILPIDASRTFAANKTYLLVGMTGDLGQSLCRFMVSSGARNIVIASRNPPLNAKWVRSLNKRGANICVVQMDVSDRNQVRQTAMMIRDTMPALGGVANATLVLQDSLFANTTAASVERQLAPKVDGTRHLDDEFAQDNPDFFIAFSSLGSETGNPGQSIYHAANMFMASLVANRRERGLAASVIHIGMILDVGYITKADGKDLERRLKAEFYEGLSETDFHNLFVQAIVSGKPDCLNAELIMGLKKFVQDTNPEAPRPRWYGNPRFSHMISSTPSSSAPGDEQNQHVMSKSSVEVLRTRFRQAGNPTEIAVAFQELFSRRLESLTKVPMGSVDTKAPLFELGLDSLLAVEIRSWLLKETGVEIPVLSIFRQESVSSVTSRVVTEHTPRLKNQGPVGTVNITNSMERPETPASDSSSFPTTTETSNAPSSSDGTSSPVSSVISAMTPDSEPFQDKVIAALASVTGPTTTSAQPSSFPSILGESVFTLVEDAERESKAFVGTPEYLLTEKVSFSQASLHFLDSFLSNPTALNVTTQFDIAGELNIPRFSRALERTIAQHQAFQTSFFTEPGSSEVRQGILASSTVKKSHLTHLNLTNNDEVDRMFDMLAGKRWDLSSGHTLQCVLVTRSAQSHTVIFGCHHIIVDAASWHAFSRDLDMAYQLQPLPPSSSYLDFSKQQMRLLDSGEMDQGIAYWTRELMDPLPEVMPLLPFAMTKTRQSSQQEARKYLLNHNSQRELGPVIVDRVKHISQTCQATPMQVYLATLQTLLCRLLDLEDICIGVAQTGRGSNDGPFADTVGHFTNILPMRFRVDKGGSFSNLLGKTSATVLSGLAHGDVPLEVIIRNIRAGAGAHRQANNAIPALSPLFQVAFNYRIGDLLHKRLGNCTIDLVRFKDADNPYDLAFNIMQSSQGAHILHITSNAELYSSAATDTILDMYADLLQSVCQDPSRDLHAYSMCTPERAEKAIELGRGPRIQQRPWPETLTERVGQVCLELPNSIAIREEGKSVTYAQLRLQVDKTARALLDSAGAITTSISNSSSGSRIVVAVLCEPSAQLYAAMLAVLRIGAVYLPLDPTLPMGRHREMLEVSAPSLLVFHDRTADRVASLNGHVTIPVLNLSTVAESSGGDSSTAPTVCSHGDGAFLLFTSGSTGKPKGIKLTQQGFMNYAMAKSALLDLHQPKVLQQSSIGFDMSLAQVFNAFVNGGTLVIAPSLVRGDPVRIAELMLQESVDLTIATPSEYGMLATYAGDILGRCVSWRHACSGGEVLSGSLVSALRKLELPGLALVDCYGPTEVSCSVTLQIVQLDGNAPVPNSVGNAIPNTSLYVVGKDNEPLGVGMPGEICVGGAGVARGYLDTASVKLDASNFIPDKIAPPEDIARGWGAMYKTGDKGCLRDDGSLVYLGRIDDGTSVGVVKIRGLRVDLQGVASALLTAADGRLLDAVVTLRGQPGSEFLVAHVLGSGRQVPSRVDFDHVKARLVLPRYMIPSIIVSVDSLPKTANGKVDRRAVERLPLSDSRDVVQEPSEENGEAPVATLAEGELRWIWQDVLSPVFVHDKPNIGPETDFFAVGGSSLLLVHLQSAIKEKMGISMELHRLYAASTLSKMAVALSQQRECVVPDAIDWLKETSVPGQVLEYVDAALTDSNDSGTMMSSVPRSTNRQVILTGSTGFLGGEILKVLVASPDVSKIHCIAVADRLKDKLPSAAADAKVIIYSGSLSSPSLGLSQHDIKTFQSNADQIIHAGAQGHCLNNYFSVRQANYMSTQFLATVLALPRRVPMHLISSPRVILFSGACTVTSENQEPSSLAAFQPPTDGSEGFTASKWASERFLEELSRLTKLPVTIHRPCSPIGPSAPHDDAVNAVIRYSVLSRTVPYAPSAEGFFDFQDVGVLAAAIVATAPIITPSSEKGRLPVSFYHHSSGIPVPCNKLAERLREVHQCSFETVSLSEWIENARKLGVEELIAMYLEAKVAEGGRLRFPYLGRLATI
ncbi:lovastatin nonaketide synthase [Rhypophila decipiens]